LPLISGGTYNFTVDWGDGSSDTITAYNQAEVTHTYATADTYDVNITGTIEGWQFNNAGDKDKITNIAAWGPLVITTDSAFYGCINLDTTVTDAPTLSTTDLRNTFRGCSSLTTLDVSNWNVSSVTNLRAIFYGCSSLTTLDVSSWNVSSAIDFGYTFHNCFSLTTLDVDLWDINQGTIFISFANGVSIPTADYDDILIAWEAQAPIGGRSISFGNSQYTAGGAAEAARTSLINTYGWTITDGGGIPTFISTWQTTTPSETITLPLVATGNYNFTVDWGDGNTDTITAYNQAEVTHTYATANTYDVQITGNIEGWQFDNAGDKDKITNISSWGPLVITTDSAFYGCSNLDTLSPTAHP